MGMYLPPFEPEREFVAAASFRADGDIWQRGKSFDKSRVNLRVLRQLYDARKITYADAPKRAVTIERRIAADRAKAPQPSEDEAIKALIGRYNKAVLLKHAEGLEGVTAAMSKAQIAAELVKSGRGIS